MSRLRSRVLVRTKLAASFGAGLGLAGLLSGWTFDGADAKSRRDAKRDETALSRPLDKPVMAIVSINRQHITVYDAHGPMQMAPVSTGRNGYETPAGIFTVLQKRAEHYSNLYDDAAMPFMQRLTWSGIALHAGALPGYPASHGCIRMPFGFAERLFAATRLGMRVIVMRDDISPADFAHPALFKPLPEDAVIAGPATGDSSERLAYASASPGVPASARPRRSLRAIAAAKSAAAAAAAKTAEEALRAARGATVEAARASRLLRRAQGVKYRAEQRLRSAEQAAGAAAASQRAQQAKADAQAALAAAQAQLDAVSAEMQPKIDLALGLREKAKEAAAIRAAAQEEAKEAARKLAPISVFISRATQRLYVRQDREPLFDAPVTIADAARPLGTYIFTALAYKNGESDLRWNVVSMYQSQAAAGAHTRNHRHAGTAPADRAGAKAALDRIAIPDDAVLRISELVAPGASLIVSDEGLSRETGKATEFIVVMSGEPQGGIKIRRRSPAQVRYPRYPRAYGSPFGWSGPSFGWWQ